MAAPLLLACLLCACSSPPKRSAFATTGEFVELNVLTAPVGLDLDGRPGLEGISVKVYANIANNPKTVPIRSGDLEVVMFDGTLYGRTNLPPPLHTWSFTASELRRYEFTAGIGTGYELLLPWGQDVPTQRLVSVGARHISAQGRVLTSTLSSVTVLNR